VSSTDLKTEKDSVSETLCSVVFGIPDDGQSPVILSTLQMLNGEKCGFTQDRLSASEMTGCLN
jgi:hypothetical protein